MSDADAIHQLVAEINTLTPLVGRKTTVVEPATEEED